MTRTRSNFATSPGRSRAALDEYVERYARVVSRVRYEHVRALQEPPHANLSQGAAGIAYALVRLAESGHLPDGLRLAKRWLRDAMHDRARSASSAIGRRTTPPSSVIFGRAGLDVIGVLAPSNRADRDRSLERLARASARTRVGEVMDGLAGHLIAATMIRRRHDAPSLREHGDALLERLAERARRRMQRPWRAIDATSFAHGWPGILYAMLFWIEGEGRRVDDWFVDGLRRLARVTVEGVTSSSDATWCNGAAGVALLWCKAFETTRDVAFLQAARNVAANAEQHAPARTHLCCGAGGVAYALLALDRVDPDRGWRRRAVRIGERAVVSPLVSRWPNGLLWGHPGLVCLANDLRANRPLGFPAIEG